MSSSEEESIFASNDKHNDDKKELKIWNKAKKFRKEKLV